MKLPAQRPARACLAFVVRARAPGGSSPDRQCPCSVGCSEGAACTSIPNHVLARGNPNEGHAPLTEDHGLASGRREVVQRPLGSTEARQVDPPTVNPEIPRQVPPGGVERLPRSLPVSVADEEPLHPGDEARPAVTPRLPNERFAEPPDLVVGSCSMPRTRVIVPILPEGFQKSGHAAWRWYSWIRPPSRS